MELKSVADLMIPIEEYPTVSLDASLLDAIRVVKEAQETRPRTRAFYRAVLVTDRQGKVVGKLGQLRFLQALEPKYSSVGTDFDKLASVQASPEYLASMMDQMGFFEESLAELCQRQLHMPVKNAMRPVTVTIAVDTPLGEALHLLVVTQQLSLVVADGEEAVGLLRLSDLCDEVVRYMVTLE